MEQTFARLHQAIDYLKDIGKIHKQQDIVDNLGIAKSNLSMALKGNERYLTEGFLRRFAAAYSDYINEDWLLTGEGEMRMPDKNLRPHFDTKVSAGFLDGLSEAKMSAEFRAMAIPTLNYDFSIEVQGDSMNPKIENGDTLLCRELTDRANPPIGKICLIDAKDGAVTKIISAVSEDSILLHSLNPQYPDYEMELSSIIGVALVVGLIRAF